MKKITTLILSLILSLTAMAGDKLVEAFTSLPKTTIKSNDFDKWTYNTTLGTVQNCWKYRNPNQALPKALDKNVIGSANWTNPSEYEFEPLCSSLETQGIKPVCNAAVAWVDEGPKDSTIPREYLLTNTNKFKLMAGIQCYLNSQKVQEQSFLGEVKYQWLSQPQKKSIMTTNGEREFQVGQILIIAPGTTTQSGRTYLEPRNIIVLQ